MTDSFTEVGVGVNTVDLMRDESAAGSLLVPKGLRSPRMDQSCGRLGRLWWDTPRDGDSEIFTAKTAGAMGSENDRSLGNDEC